MARYQVRTISYLDADFEEGALLSMSEAAQLLGLSMGGVQNLLDLGRVTCVIDQAAPSNQGRRLLIRSEVEQWQTTRRSRPEISATEAAQVLGLSKSRVTQLVKAGKLQLTKEGLRQRAAQQNE